LGKLVEYPLSKMLGTKNTLHFFRFLNIHIRNEKYHRWDPSLNTGLIYDSYIPYTHSLKVISNKVWWCGSFHLWHHIGTEKSLSF
jgi:hypothetical protein